MLMNGESAWNATYSRLQPQSSALPGQVTGRLFKQKGRGGPGSAGGAQRVSQPFCKGQRHLLATGNSLPPSALHRNKSRGAELPFACSWVAYKSLTSAATPVSQAGKLELRGEVTWPRTHREEAAGPGFEHLPPSTWGSSVSPSFWVGTRDLNTIWGEAEGGSLFPCGCHRGGERFFL